MPGPPPPPPLGGLPPPPMPSMLPPKGGGSDDRAALLKSIQRGARLKKAVTNDRSAPAVAGGNSGGKPANAQSPSQQAPNGLNLGGLFAGGMPKLRATGKPGASTLKNSNNIDVTRKPEVPSQPVKTHASVQSELRKQMANDSRNRGPPPPAPVRSGFENGTKASHVNGVRANQSSLHSNSSTLHRREMSNTSLCSPDSTDSMNGINQHHNVKPVISHGKPNLAPKPPNLNGKPTAPPKKLLVNGKAISRAHSMKSPRSPSPQSPDANPAIKFGTVRNLSSVIGHSLANSTGNLSPRPRPMLNGRPNAPPPQVPSQQPPHGYSPQSSAPPPPSKTAVRPPNHAPPPPPTSLPQVPPHTPPPPPHRTLPTRAPPAVPGNAAPPPPPRHSSMTTHRKLIVDFEEKFKFNPSTTFPKPPPYRNVFKIYSSRQGSTC